jgi:hypothetical protein
VTGDIAMLSEGQTTVGTLFTLCEGTYGSLYLIKY